MATSIKTDLLGRIPAPGISPLKYLSPDEVLEVESSLYASRAKTEPSLGNRNIIDLLQIPDVPLAKFRDSYSQVCFSHELLCRGGFEKGRPLLELSSGNNDLGYFSALASFLPPLYGTDSYFLANYSGGRGDYFALQQLAKIHTAEAKVLGCTNYTPSIEQLCMTVGGQGALSATAAYLAKFYPNKAVALPNSNYCGIYAPFLYEGVPLVHMTTPERSALPTLQTVLDTIDSQDVGAWMYVKYHNPSGEKYSREELEEIVSSLKKNDQYLIYPEAYELLSHYQDNSDYLDIVKICDEKNYRKLIRVKTIAKEFCFSGARGGYLIAPEEVAHFAQNRNALTLFNAPMTSAPLLVACAYTKAHHLLGVRLDDIEQYLGPLAQEIIIHPHLGKQISEQQDELKSRVDQVIKEIFPGCSPNNQGMYENEHFFLRVPKGGINVHILLKALDGYDAATVHRRAYLLTGLILHPGEFLGHKPGFWTRITISHREARLQEALKALKVVIQEKALFKESVKYVKQPSQKKLHL